MEVDFVPVFRAIGLAESVHVSIFIALGLIAGAFIFLAARYWKVRRQTPLFPLLPTGAILFASLAVLVFVEYATSQLAKPAWFPVLSTFYFKTGIPVLGLLHVPVVMAGMMMAHLFLRERYADQPGALFNRFGVPFWKTVLASAVLFFLLWILVEVLV